MDIEAELKASRKKLQDITRELNQLSREINNLGDQKQDLLQEALRLDGEVRLLLRLKSKSGKPA